MKYIQIAKGESINTYFNKLPKIAWIAIVFYIVIMFILSLILCYGTHIETSNVIGIVDVNDRSYIESEQTGIVQQVFVKDGDSIEKGELLYKFDESEWMEKIKQIDIKINNQIVPIEHRKKLIEIIGKGLKNTFDLTNPVEFEYYTIIEKYYTELKNDQSTIEQLSNQSTANQLLLKHLISLENKTNEDIERINTLQLQIQNLTKQMNQLKDQLSLKQITEINNQVQILNQLLEEQESLKYEKEQLTLQIKHLSIYSRNSGVIHFMKNLNQNSMVQMGEVLYTIQANQVTNQIRFMIPAQLSSKTHIGQVISFYTGKKYITTNITKINQELLYNESYPYGYFEVTVDLKDSELLNQSIVNGHLILSKQKYYSYLLQLIQ